MPRILVGGDNDTTANIHSAIRSDLPSQQFSAFYCTNPKELRHQLDNGGANLIIIHYEFSRQSDVEIYRHFRALPAAQDLPILILQSEILGSGEEIVDPRLGVLAEPVTKVGLFTAIGERLGLRIECDEHAILSMDAIPEEVLPPKDMEATDPTVEDGVSTTRLSLSGEVDIRRYGDGDNVFYMIPEAFRKRWFYGSDTIQATLDWVEDTTTYQDACRKRDGRALETREVKKLQREKRKARRPSRKERREIRKKARQEDTEKVSSCFLAKAVLALAFLAVGSAIAFAGAIAYEMFSDKRPDSSIVAEVQCSICAFHEADRVKNIHEERCRKCSGELGFCYTCKICGKSFAFIPEDSGVKTIGNMKSIPLCPTCREASQGQVVIFEPHFSAFD